MALRPTFEREAMLSLRVEPLYSEADARELMMGIGPPDGAADIAARLAHHLSELGKQFAFNLWGEVQATVPEREREAERLAAACQKVLDIAGVADGGELLPLFGGGGLFTAAHVRGEARGEAFTMNALRAVDLLRQDALRMRAVLSKRRQVKGVSAGNRANKAMQQLVCELSCLYETVWNKAPGVSNDLDQQPSGPFVRLMVDVTTRLRARLGNNAFSASPASLRRCWQRLDPHEKMPITLLLQQAAQ